MIRDLILDFTRACNSRCTTCNIWRSGGAELPLETIGGLFSSELLSGLRNVYLTGGEPYLTDKILDIAALLRDKIPGCGLSGATNGLLPSQISEFAAIIKAMGIRLHVDVSLNGRKEAHDLTRGTEGAWEAAIETIHKLLSLNIPVGIAYLAHPDTIEEYSHILKFAETWNLPVGITWARPTLRYRWVEPKMPGDWENWGDRVQEIENLPRFFDCPGMRDIIVVRPDGEVWPCEQYNLKLSLGNLHKQSLDEIRESARWTEVFWSVAARNCQPFDLVRGPCQMDCYARRARCYA